MTVSRDQVGRAYRVGQMRCEYVKVLPSIFTKHESFRVKVWNRSAELAIHALDSMYWCQISRPLSATSCDSRQRSVCWRVFAKVVSGRLWTVGMDQCTPLLPSEQLTVLSGASSTLNSSPPDSRCFSCLLQAARLSCLKQAVSIKTTHPTRIQLTQKFASPTISAPEMRGHHKAKPPVRNKST
jgi:hypothetical protein